jgi:hypothetical protein
MCDLCDKMTEEYLKKNPKKRGFVLCEKCFEESKEYCCYLDFSYNPDSKYPDRKYLR